MEKNQALAEKASARELDESNQKRLQKIVGKFLYYARAIDPTMFVALNSLTELQSKPSIKTAKKITQFINYSATHPDAVTEYRKIGMVIHIYLDASYISEPEARSRAGGCFFLGKKSNTPIQAMPPGNGPVHLECRIIRNVMASVTEA